MAEGVVLRIDTEEYNDATAARIYDKTVWNSQEENVDEAKIVLRSPLSVEELTLYLIDPDTADRTIFESFLSEGFINVNPGSFIPAGENIPANFPDGYYEFELIIHIVGDEDDMNYVDNQGFLAFMTNEAQRMQLKMPAYVVERFMTLHVYLYCAKAAASVGQISKFTRFVNYINSKLNNYEISLY